MALKYVRHEEIGFVLWPRTDALWHSHVGRLLQQKRDGKIVSAGFVEFGQDGKPVCFGMSESLNITSKDGDSEALAQQLGLLTANDQAKGREHSERPA